MGLIETIKRGPVALDTCIFIYWIEEQAKYLSRIAPLFERIAAGKLQAVTSALTLFEALVIPYRARDVLLAQRYEHLLTRSAGLRLVALDQAQLRIAAQLRATVRIRTPDALQLAAARARGCRVFVTNDRELPASIGPIKILQLRDFAAGY